MYINKKFHMKPFSGSSYADPNQYIQVATTDTNSHLNVYIGGGKSLGAEVCIAPDTASELVTFLAKAFGLVPNESVETRKVVVDATGNFVRFAEENEE